MIKDKLYSTYLDAICDKVAERTVELSGIPPLSFTSKGKPLTAWSITGNTVQNGTPTPENPVEVLGCGDYDSETGLYRIPIVTSADGTEPITTPIYLPTPLYSGEVMRSDGSRDVKFGKLVLTGSEKWSFQSINSYGIANFYIKVDKPFVPSKAFSTHFSAQNTLIGQTTNEGVFLSVYDVIYIRIKSELADTVSRFESYLKEQYTAGTPVTVWYPLAEPTTETFTAPQIPTINGTTVIDVDTAVKPESMTIKYKAV